MVLFFLAQHRRPIILCDAVHVVVVVVGVKIKKRENWVRFLVSTYNKAHFIDKS